MNMSFDPIIIYSRPLASLVRRTPTNADISSADLAQEKVQALRAKDLQGGNEYSAIFNTVLNSRSDCGFYPNRSFG
jgi:hypothetical protein